MNIYCPKCGSDDVEFVDCEWQKYNFSDSEEIVSVYKCNECKIQINKRDGNHEPTEKF
jgi:DNA-directed RNA polymerase subunit RPC12/RpoP